MTDRRAEIEGRLAGIHAFPSEPNEWHYDDDGFMQVRDYGGRLVASVEGVAELGLIANAPADFRWLLDRLDEAERERDAAREIARLAEESETGWRRDADEAWAAHAALRERVQALADEWDHNGGAWDECASCLRALLDEGGESDA